MSVLDAIERKLRAGFRVAHVEVENESHRHNVAPGAETHFKVVLVSDEFTGKSLVQRHRAVYGALGAELQGGVHALALHTYTPEEWSARAAAPASPPCRGGGKG